MKVKIQELSRLKIEVYRLKMEAWRVCIGQWSQIRVTLMRIWIRICMEVKSWTRIRVKVKSCMDPDPS
jgi:hypothetical protein